MTAEPPIDVGEFDGGMHAAVANMRPPPGASLWWLRGYALAQYHIRLGAEFLRHGDEAAARFS